MKTWAEYKRIYRKTHPEYVQRSNVSLKIWQVSPRGKAIRAAWRLKNKERIKNKTRESSRKFRNTLTGLIANRLRSRIGHALRNGLKREHTYKMLGCSFGYFKHFLERQFLPGMSWANRHLWHIDHRIPVSAFDLTTLEGQQWAFHYSNCQPLWAVDNLRKGATII